MGNVEKNAANMVNVAVLIENRLASRLNPPVFALTATDQVFPHQTAPLLRD